MIVELTPRMKFVCDRCGKEEFPNEKGELIIHPTVVFEVHKSMISLPNRKQGQVCMNCLADFRDFAENFFDEVNKEMSEKEHKCEKTDQKTIEKCEPEDATAKWLLETYCHIDCTKCTERKKGCFTTCPFYQTYKKKTKESKRW